MNVIYFLININYKIKTFLLKMIIYASKFFGLFYVFLAYAESLFSYAEYLYIFQILFLFLKFLIKIIKVTNQFVGRMKCINSIRIIYSVKIKQSVTFVLCRWLQCKMTVSDLAEHDWSSTTVYMYIHN